MTEKQKKDRQKRSAQLEVKEIAPHTYLVQSQSNPAMYHKVINLNGSPSCSCLDWKKNHEADPSWTCKHQEAARALEEAHQPARSNGPANGANGKLSPQEKERLNLEVAVMFGDQAAADKLNATDRTAKAQAPQVQPPASAETEEPLDPCSECGQLLPASEMIPWQAPNGSGLICPECHQAHKEIQSELKALEETSAEPGIPGTGSLPQPAAHCALCGGEFPLAGDPSLSCKSCELKAQERISSPRRDTLPEPQDNHGPTDSPSGIPTEIPEPEEEIPAGEETVQMESCLVCHAKAPADEMILVSVPSGTGLVCRTCYDGRKACAFCGARLPIEQMITVPTSSGAGLVCEGCYSKSRACSHCGDHFLIEQMIAIREPGFFGYYCPECAKEYEAERAREAKVITLADRIARANEVLASFGNAAIEKVVVKNRQGQVVKELFGYGLQYTLDAVNAALGPDAWKYKLLEWRTGAEDKGALVLVELELFDGTRWHSHGPMFGTTGLADEGDSFKGAIGDALKKSLAYWGIGNLSYRGELRMGKA